MRAVHYLPEGYLWPACGTAHDIHVTEHVAEVTCGGCKQTKLWMRAQPRMPRNMELLASSARMMGDLPIGSYDHGYDDARGS